MHGLLVSEYSIFGFSQPAVKTRNFISPNYLHSFSMWFFSFFFPALFLSPSFSIVVIRYKLYTMSSTQELVWIQNMYLTSSKQELVEIHNQQKLEKFIINLYLRISTILCEYYLNYIGFFVFIYSKNTSLTMICDYIYS